MHLIHTLLIFNGSYSHIRMALETLAVFLLTKLFFFFHDMKRIQFDVKRAKLSIVANYLMSHSAYKASKSV